MRKKKPVPQTRPSQIDCGGSCVLPVLATAEEIALPLGITSRTVTAWAAADKIPVALRAGKILRFYPPAVAAALGLDVPGFGPPSAKPGSNQYPPNPSNLISK